MWLSTFCCGSGPWRERSFVSAARAPFRDGARVGLFDRAELLRGDGIGRAPGAAGLAAPVLEPALRLRSPRAAVIPRRDAEIRLQLAHLIACKRGLCAWPDASAAQPHATALAAAGRRLHALRIGARELDAVLRLRVEAAQRAVELD